VNTSPSNDAPIGTEYWPVRPNEYLTTTQAELSVPSREWCNDSRDDWLCSRAKEHPLPHVAVGSKVVAVWDQLWFSDVHRTCPVADVRTTRRK
jgi:hypothetical protein